MQVQHHVPELDGDHDVLLRPDLGGLHADPRPLPELQPRHPRGDPRTLRRAAAARPPGPQAGAGLQPAAGGGHLHRSRLRHQPRPQVAAGQGI